MEELLYYAHQEMVGRFPFLDIPWGAYFELTRIGEPIEALMGVLLYSVGLIFSASLAMPPLQPKEFMPQACRAVLWVYYMRHALCTFKDADASSAAARDPLRGELSRQTKPSTLVVFCCFLGYWAFCIYQRSLMGLESLLH